MPTEREISELRRLVEYGFVNWPEDDKEKDELKSKIKKDLKSLDSKKIEKIAKADEIEQYKGGNGFPVKVKVGFPKPEKRFRLVYELYNQSIEETYFWILHQLRSDLGMNEVIKITDIMTASESSAVWGQTQQRIGAQQANISGYLKGISDMVRTGLFQMIREIRGINEKLDYYNPGVNNDFALKGSWIDLVKGGAKNASSIYGLSQNLQMVTLPDLFFRTNIHELDPEKAQSEIEKKVKELKSSFNDKVLEILGRQLSEYVTWRSHSKKELEQRRRLTIKYLRQHYNTIKLYMSWVKPYLKNVKRLGMNDKQIDSPDIISAFESAVTEIEILTRRRVGSFKVTTKEKVKDKNTGQEVEKEKTVEKDMYAVVLATITEKSKPSLDYHKDGYQHKGPIHIGKIEIELRSYAWDEEQCTKYKDMKDSEIFAMLGEFDITLKDIFDEFDEELKKYLTAEGEKFEEEKAEKEKTGYKDDPLAPFKGILDGFKDIFGPLIPEFEKKGPPTSEEEEKEKALKSAKGVGEFAIWNAYKNYKKSHGMLSW